MWKRKVDKMSAVDEILSYKKNPEEDFYGILNCDENSSVSRSFCNIHEPTTGMFRIDFTVNSSGTWVRMLFECFWCLALRKLVFLFFNHSKQMKVVARISKRNASSVSNPEPFLLYFSTKNRRQPRAAPKLYTNSIKAGESLIMLQSIRQTTLRNRAFDSL